MLEEGELEEELADKPGTTIGTQFSVLHCIRVPFLIRCGFWVMADFGQTDFGQFFDRLWPIVVLTDFGQTDFGQF